MNGNYISRNDTQSLKGIAILLMLFYHLFLYLDYAQLCTSLIDINSLPLVWYMTRGANPVAFFLILGGYGMYIVTERGDKHRYSRIIKLLIHYWVITILFLLLGCCLCPEYYPGSILAAVENFTLYRTSYNGDIWFLLPYIIISLMAPFLFGLSKRIPMIPYLFVFLLLYGVLSFITSRYQLLLQQDAYYWLCLPIRVFRLMFAFVLGGMAAKERLFRRVSFFRNSWRVWFCIFLLFIARCCITTSMFDVFYAFVMLFLLLQLRRPIFIDKTLIYLGNHSMNIWMIHHWIFASLFTSFIFGFRYPLFCWIALVLVSLLCSIVVNKICSVIINSIKF